MNRWLWSVTEENWDVTRDYSVWAVKDEHRTKQIKMGDHIVFYVMKTGLFRGIYQVTSRWYKSDKLIWLEEADSGEKIYEYECKLRPVLIKDVIFNSISSKLEFSKQYVHPSIVLKGSPNGPANFSRPLSEQDMNIIANNMTSIIKPEQIAEDSDHKEIIEYLSKIGDALGFEVHTEQEYTLVSPGSVVDMIWETRIGNVGIIKYSFEILSKGSIQPMINNLIQSMNDPAVKKVIVISDAKQLETIRDMVTKTNAYTSMAKSMFVFLDVQMIREFFTLVPKLNTFKKMLFV